MATVNFRVPEQVKQEFNQLFATENKSAILTQLMLQAIETRKQQQRRALASLGFFIRAFNITP